MILVALTAFFQNMVVFQFMPMTFLVVIQSPVPVAQGTGVLQGRLHRPTDKFGAVFDMAQFLNQFPVGFEGHHAGLISDCHVSSPDFIFAKVIRFNTEIK